MSIKLNVKNTLAPIVDLILENEWSLYHYSLPTNSHLTFLDSQEETRYYLMYALIIHKTFCSYMCNLIIFTFVSSHNTITRHLQNGLLWHQCSTCAIIGSQQHDNTVDIGTFITVASKSATLNYRTQVIFTWWFGYSGNHRTIHGQFSFTQWEQCDHFR